jgi:hypothetical protein
MACTSFKTRAVLLSAAAFVALLSSTAQAGFEWKGPMAPPVAAAKSPEPLISPSSDMKDLEPTINWSAESAATAMPVVKMEEVEKTPVAGPSVEPPVIAAPVSTGSVSTGAVLEGFGSGIPLVVALQQITPAGYYVSFAQGVNPGTMVSWSGGKAWEDVLSETLSSQGLSFKIQDNAVIVMYDNLKSALIPMQAEEVPPTIFVQRPIPAMRDVRPLQKTWRAGSASSVQKSVDIRRNKPSSLLEKMNIDPVEETGRNVAVARTHPDQQSWDGFSGPRPSAPQVIAPTVLPKRSTEGPIPLISTPQQSEVSSEAAWSHPPVLADVQAMWRGTKGQTLRSVLKNWSETAGVELYWAIDYDYRLEENVDFSGTYDEVVGKILDKFAVMRPQPYGQLHQSGEGPRVLVIKSYDLAG